MACIHCGSERVAYVSAKCSDRCDVAIGDHERSGYVPTGMGIGGGDYVRFAWCLDCMRIQTAAPLPPTALEGGA
jgi:hypothetical protein